VSLVITYKFYDSVLALVEATYRVQNVFINIVRIG